MVTTDTAQTISGEKTFGKINVNTIQFDATQNWNIIPSSGNPFDAKDIVNFQNITNQLKSIQSGSTSEPIYISSGSLDNYVELKTINNSTLLGSGNLSLVTPSDLATVATTGSYTDLSNIPTNLVTTNNNQTITGNKSFTGVTTLGQTSVLNSQLNIGDNSTLLVNNTLTHSG